MVAIDIPSVVVITVSVTVVWIHAVSGVWPTATAMVVVPIVIVLILDVAVRPRGSAIPLVVISPGVVPIVTPGPAVILY